MRARTAIVTILLAGLLAAALVFVLSGLGGLVALQYQRLDDLVEAIGLPKEKLCTYCWDGAE